MVRVSPAKLRPWSELTAKMVMGVVPGLVRSGKRPPFWSVWLSALQESRVAIAKIASDYDCLAHSKRILRWAKSGNLKFFLLILLFFPLLFQHLSRKKGQNAQKKD